MPEELDLRIRQPVWFHWDFVIQRGYGRREQDDGSCQVGDGWIRKEAMHLIDDAPLS